MFPSNFMAGFVGAVLLVGAVLGLAFAGLLWLAIYLWRHIDIVWLP